MRTGRNLGNIFNYCIVNQHFWSLNQKLWEEIGFHRQIYSFPMKNWNFRKMAKHIVWKDMFCWEYEGFFREELQPAPAPMSCLCTHHQLQRRRLIFWNKLLLGNVKILQTLEWFFLQSNLSLKKFIYSSYIFFGLLTLLYSCQSHLVSP